MGKMFSNYCVNYSSVNSDVSSKDKTVVDTSFTTSNQMISENINNSQKVEEFDFSYFKSKV